MHPDQLASKKPADQDLLCHFLKKKMSGFSLVSVYPLYISDL